MKCRYQCLRMFQKQAAATAVTATAPAHQVGRGAVDYVSWSQFEVQQLQ